MGWVGRFENWTGIRCSRHLKARKLSDTLTYHNHQLFGGVLVCLVYEMVVIDLCLDDSDNESSSTIPISGEKRPFKESKGLSSSTSFSSSSSSSSPFSHSEREHEHEHDSEGDLLEMLLSQPSESERQPTVQAVAVSSRSCKQARVDQHHHTAKKSDVGAEEMMGANGREIECPPIAIAAKNPSYKSSSSSLLSAQENRNSSSETASAPKSTATVSRKKPHEPVSEAGIPAKTLAPPTSTSSRGKSKAFVSPNITIYVPHRELNSVWMRTLCTVAANVVPVPRIHYLPAPSLSYSSSSSSSSVANVEELSMCLWTRPANPVSSFKASRKESQSQSMSESQSQSEPLAIAEDAHIVVPYALVFFPARHFIHLALTDDYLLSFPRLTSTISELRDRMERLGLPSNSRLTVLMLQMGKTVSTYAKDRGLDKVNIANCVEQARAWLLLEHGVEWVGVESQDQQGEHICLVTEYLGKAPETLPHDPLQLANQLSLIKDKKKADTEQDQSILHKAVWSHMLQQLPRVSGKISSTAAGNYEMSCPKNCYDTLRRAETNGGEGANWAAGTNLAAAKVCLRHVFGSGDNPALSSTVYDVFMSRDETLVLND